MTDSTKWARALAAGRATSKPLPGLPLDNAWAFGSTVLHAPRAGADFLVVKHSTGRLFAIEAGDEPNTTRVVAVPS